jgi:stearoyl-CoA desaturase (Delta-9 desaturase)
MPILDKRAHHEKIAWFKSMPFILFHLTPIALLWVDISIGDVAWCFALYYVRMFFITAGFHRYFAHRTFKMGRFAQFFMAFGGCLAAQKGPLWWASHHRMHHKYSDTDLDVHSPKKGFFWSHVGWILSAKYDEPLYERIGDFAKFPELRWLDRYYLVPPLVLGAALWYFAGTGAFVMGGCVSTVLLYHGTFFINSLAHVFGSRRYATDDTSRNSLLLALITCGEGWHNNHHHFQASARQGFRWWEIDVSYYVLKLFEVFGVVKGIKEPPAKALNRGLISDGCFDVGMFNLYYDKALYSINCVKNEAKTIYEKKQVLLAEVMDQTKVVADELAALSMEHEAKNFSIPG